MRTTLALDDDVLARARRIAERDRQSLGAVISDLARQGLKLSSKKVRSASDLPLLPKRGVVVTMELVNRLREELD